MTRSLLEKANWVAGIVGAVIALATLAWGVYVYYAPGVTTSVSQDPTTRWSPYRNLVIPSCNEVKTKDLRVAYDIARDLPTQQGRDSAYVTLVGEAMCLKDYAFAEQLLNRVTATPSRDRAARIGTEFLLEAKRYEDARRWAASLSDPRDKEWFMKRILDAARPGS